MLDQVTERECFIKDFPRNVTFKVRVDKRYWELIIFNL